MLRNYKRKVLGALINNKGSFLREREPYRDLEILEKEKGKDEPNSGVQASRRGRDSPLQMSGAIFFGQEENGEGSRRCTN